MFIGLGNVVFGQDIVIDGNTNTTLSTSGNTTSVSTSTIKNNKAFNSFNKFNVSENKTVNLKVPGNSEALINIVRSETTKIDGTLNSIQNGQVGGNVFIVNPHGMVIGQQGQVNVGSLTAVTSNQDFVDNFFDGPGNPNNSSVDAVINGTAPINSNGTVENNGVIKAFENVKIDAGNIINKGEIHNRTTFTAEELNIDDFVNTENIEGATDLVLNNGKIVLKSENSINSPGKIVSHSENSDIISAITLESKGDIMLGNETVISARGKADLAGGTVNIKSKSVALGGLIDVTGSTGGTVTVKAQGLSLADNIIAKGISGIGGLVDIKVTGQTLETSSSTIDVSGTTGGTLKHIAGQQITTSGNYKAIGNNGIGGNIYISAPALKFLSTQIDASGSSGGGEILLGGEYQGGKNLETDFIPNAQTLAMSGGTVVKASTNGLYGDGGTIISWADQNAVVLGDFYAKPGTVSGDGGFVEVSSGDTLTFGGNVDTGYDDRLGTFLLDPKNITIADEDYNQYSIIMGYNYDQLNPSYASIETDDYYGATVSLDGNRLAVGAPYDNGFGNLANDTGAVYLYTFADENFTGANLVAIIGYGYTGGNNIDDDNIGNNNYFGSSVSLDGNRLAVGAVGDDGFFGGVNESGCVYLYTFTDSIFHGGVRQAILGIDYTGGKNIDLDLMVDDNLGSSVSLDGNRLAVGAGGFDGYGAVGLFSFTDLTFSGGVLEGIIGNGYTTGKNINQNLDSGDRFGQSVSLNGNRLVVGASADFGASDINDYSGAVYLYSFTDSTFNGGNLEAIIGSGYTGGKNINQPLDSFDCFGLSVSLDGNRLAVGAGFGDDGYDNLVSNSGAVYLYNFTDSTFSGGILEATIGSGYTGGKNINLNLEDSDQFGYSVSLDGNRLAVGVKQDDGFNNSTIDSGAVYLFIFDDSEFNNASTPVMVGSGYTSTATYDQSLEDYDYFGAAVSLDSNRLAVGAYGDDGYDNLVLNSGAVYLFSFDDQNFNGTTLEAIIGDGYVGGKNYDISLEADDWFGKQVSLSGNSLAVSAATADGNGNTLNASGEVYLFTFSDSEFSGANLEGIIGYGYSGGKNIDVTNLGAGDNFGTRISLDVNKLAVGSYDGGISNTVNNAGAVYLFSFTDNEFSGGSLKSIIGYGYTGGNNYDMTSYIEAGDYMEAPALDGNRLAIGAPIDAGSLNSYGGSGAIYLFTFDDDNFSNLTLQGIIGENYTGGKNLDVNKNHADAMGVSVSLDGNRLVAGPN